ncbi:hypothetical protein KKB99_04170, partial [bacterium]|nr:hypothetical protein [bacterium]MBU1025189.1 hypothetical protein [bacterium]
MSLSSKIRHYLRDEVGASMVAAAIVSFFVAIVALTTLALTMAQIESVDDQTDVQQAKLVSEAGLEHGSIAIRSGDSENSPLIFDGLGDLTAQEIPDILKDPELPTGFNYNEDPDKTYYIGMQKKNISSISAVNFQTISGNSENVTITFVDDTTVVRDIKEYDYKPRTDVNENLLVSLGESRRSEAEARSAISSKSFQESETLLERRTVLTESFNENHLNPPYIESEHDSYGTNLERSWVVSYTNDPSNPNRGIVGINLMIDSMNLG